MPGTVEELVGQGSTDEGSGEALELVLALLLLGLQQELAHVQRSHSTT